MIVGIIAAGVFLVIIVAAVGFTVIKNRKGKETSSDELDKTHNLN